MSASETSPGESGLPGSEQPVAEIATVLSTLDQSRLALRAGLDGADHRDAYEADISDISARLAVLRAYLLPAARKRFRSDNAETVTLSDLVGKAERLLRGLQGTLHGQAAYNAKGSLADLHDAVASTMSEVAAAEAVLSKRLDRVLTPRQAADLVKKLTGVQDRSPTRPHPFTPHPPGLARFFFRASAASDRLMDTMDSRVLPRAAPRIPAPPAQHPSEGDKE